MGVGICFLQLLLFNKFGRGNYSHSLDLILLFALRSRLIVGLLGVLLICWHFSVFQCQILLWFCNVMTFVVEQSFLNIFKFNFNCYLILWGLRLIINLGEIVLANLSFNFRVYWSLNITSATPIIHIMVLQLGCE